MGTKASYLIDELGAVANPDVLVPIRVEHDHITFLSDRHQTHLVVPSGSAVEMLECILKYTTRGE
jgi:hypothetical protein